MKKKHPSLALLEQTQVGSEPANIDITPLLTEIEKIKQQQSVNTLLSNNSLKRALTETVDAYGNALKEVTERIEKSQGNEELRVVLEQQTGHMERFTELLEQIMLILSRNADKEYEVLDEISASLKR